MIPARPVVGGAAPAYALRPVVRHPGLALFALGTVGLVLGARYKASEMHRNELAQKSSLYVSVDRSGGGI